MRSHWIITVLCLMVAGCAPASTVTDDPVADEARVSDLRSMLTATDQQLAEARDEIGTALQDHTDRLQRLQDSLDSMTAAESAAEQIETEADQLAETDYDSDPPPAAPIVRIPDPIPAPAPIVSTSRIDSLIAQHYRRDWQYRGAGSLSQHLQREHGFSSAELAACSQRKLIQLHSAIHEMETGHRPVSTVRISNPPPVVRIRSAPVVRYQQRAIRQTPIVLQNCPGGVCPIP